MKLEEWFIKLNKTEKKLYTKIRKNVQVLSYLYIFAFNDNTNNY